MKPPSPPSGSAAKIPKHPTLIRRHLLARLKDLQPKSPVLAASLVLVQRRCGRSGCHCQKGPGHPTHYLTCKQQGKTRTVYVPQDLLQEVQSCSVPRFFRELFPFGFVVKREAMARC
jgi:hypothetical protein